MPPKPKTVTIPATTLDPNVAQPQTFGPYTLPAASTSADITIDRTVAGGLNATPAAQVQVFWYQSSDGGTTWQFAGGVGFPGGIIPDPDTGQPITSVDIEVSKLPHQPNDIKFETTTTGAAVVIAGTATLGYD